MDPTDPVPTASTRGASGASPRRPRPTSRPGAPSNGKATNGLVRINHALEPALRAAEQWRDAQSELEQLDRAHLRQRAAIITHQRRAGAQLAAFMAKTGANRQWLTALLNLPETAAIASEGADNGRA